MYMHIHAHMHAHTHTHTHTHTQIHIKYILQVEVSFTHSDNLASPKASCTEGEMKVEDLGALGHEG